MKSLFGIQLIKGFILHVGGNQWYKNRIGVCNIYAELYQLRLLLGQSQIPLILAGASHL